MSKSISEHMIWYVVAQILTNFKSMIPCIHSYSFCYLIVMVFFILGLLHVLGCSNKLMLIKFSMIGLYIYLSKFMFVR